MMAPEAMLGKKYGHKRDVWALGAMYFQLITGRYIIGSEKYSMNQLEDQMMQGEWVFPQEIMFSVQGLDFLNRLLCFNEDQRLNWADVPLHKYLLTASADHLPLSRLELFNENNSNDIQPSSLGSDTIFASAKSIDQNSPQKIAIPHIKDYSHNLDAQNRQTGMVANSSYNQMSEMPSHIGVEKEDDSFEVEQNLQSAVFHRNNSLLIDVNSVRKFSLKCQKAYEVYLNDSEASPQLPVQIEPFKKMKIEPELKEVDLEQDPQETLNQAQGR